MYSTYNEGKSVVTEIFIRILKNKIFKHMTDIQTNIYFDVLDDIVNTYNNTFHRTINPVQDGLVRNCSRIRGEERPPLPKNCHTYPTRMKLGTVILYLKKIQKVYESRDTSLNFC